ncbi:MAG: hypothetical protein Ct9H300mP19_17410 [Dehalococcoidia bacterium]|nr:MAG: hypothetical protein Ct9H300mP19_17410 [Dehalococcoidia bacterium]
MPADRALVVGAGVGGLSTAIYLALEGYRVTVFESNEVVAAGPIYLSLRVLDSTLAPHC